MFSYKFHKKQQRRHSSRGFRHRFLLEVVVALVLSLGYLGVSTASRFTNNLSSNTYDDSSSEFLVTRTNGSSIAEDATRQETSSHRMDHLVQREAGYTATKTPKKYQENSISAGVRDWTNLSDEELSKYFRTIGLSGNTVQKDQVAGVEFYWQMPLDSSHPRAILFLAHECKRSGADWFPSLSLRAPEEQAIVQMARSRGMMVVAMSALNQSNRCWGRLDAPRIVQVLQHLQRRQIQIYSPSSSSRIHIPLYAFGSANGARVICSHLQNAFNDFVSEVGVGTTLDGIIVQNVGARLNPGIPSVYITMVSEEKENEELDSALEAENSGLVRHIDLPRRPMTPTFLFQRIEGLSEEISSLIYQYMLDQDLLDPVDGSLQENPKYSPAMKNVLAATSKFLGDDFDEDLESAIVRTLMIVWGKGGTTRDGVGTALDFLLESVV